MSLYTIGHFVHIAHFHCGEMISALGREPQTIQMSVMSSCARREAGMFGQRQLWDKLEFSEPCPAEQFTGVHPDSQFSVPCRLISSTLHCWLKGCPTAPLSLGDDRKHSEHQHWRVRTLSKQVHEPLGLLVELNGNEECGFIYWHSGGWGFLREEEMPFIPQLFSTEDAICDVSCWCSSSQEPLIFHNGSQGL